MFTYYKKRILFSAVICLLVICPCGYSQQQTVSGGTGTSIKQMLQGRVEHSVNLPPIDQSFKSGSKLDIGRLKKLTPNNYWYRIPNWSAGTWKTDNETTFYKYDYQSQSRSFAIDPFGARGAETWGFQQDRLGQIWEYAYSSYVTVTDTDNALVVHIVKEHEPITISAREVVFRFRGIDCYVSKETARIEATVQKESLQTYTSAGGNLMKCISSIKTFDESGRPARLSKSVSFRSRILPFEPCNDYHGQKLRPLFEEYLNSHGMSDCLPRN